MKTEDPLRALAALPRPRLSPFFPARVMARATSVDSRARASSRVMRLYWLVLACVAASVLAPSWAGLAVLGLAGAVLGFPARTLRLLLALAACVARRR